MNEKNNIAVIDLGSNNCRLSIFQIIGEKKHKILHNSSEILNLGKNLTYNNEFSENTIFKTLRAFRAIKKKLLIYDVEKYRCIATEACRQAINTDSLVKKVFEETNIKIEVISTNEEAKLCLNSCLTFNKSGMDFNLVFDIGGGSTEIIYIQNKNYENLKNFEFISLPYGVINLSEKIELGSKENIVDKILNQLLFFRNKLELSNKKINAIGSCGTMTSICAIYQNLNYYNKSLVDQYIMQDQEIDNVIESIKQMTRNEKSNHPLIGTKKIELLNNGIMIFELISKSFIFKNLLISDRGLREGMIKEFYS